MGETSRGPGRRVGVGPLVDAAVERLLEADLADLLSFLTFATVADRAGVRPATVQHHFKKRSPDAKPNERIAHATVLRVIGGDEERATDNVERASAVSHELRKKPEATMQAFRSIAAATLRTNLANRATNRTTLLTAAVADGDPTAASILRDWYGEFAKSIEPLYERLIDAFDRRFDTEAGFDSHSYAVLLSALTDGLILRHRFDPDEVDPELYGEVVIRLFEACTVTGSAGDELPVDLRLLHGGVAHAPVPPGSGLDPDKRSAMVAAATALYDARLDTSDLTGAAVARLAGVSRTTVLSHFADASGLAWAVWGRFLPEFERHLQRDHDRGRPAVAVIERHLQRLAERAHEHPALTALAFEAAVRYRTRSRTSGLDPTDPQLLVPLPHVLVPVIIDHADHLRPGLDQIEPAYDLAVTLTDLTILRALADAQASPSDVVDQVMELAFDGARRR